MKITVNVECTAAEARDFLGLPNVQPMQASMMEHLEKRMLENLDKLSPESMLRNWMSFTPDQIQETLRGMFGALGGSKSAD